MRSCCPPPHSGSVSVLLTILGFLFHIYSSFLSFSNSFRLPLAAPSLFPSVGLLGLWLGIGEHVDPGSGVAGFASSPRRPEAEPRGMEECLLSPSCLGSCGPVPGLPLSFLLASFVLSQSLFHVVALFFSFFLFDSPFNGIFFDCSEGEGVGGKAWLLGGTSTCGKPKVKHVPFLVLEPSASPLPGQQAWLLWKQ